MTELNKAIRHLILACGMTDAALSCRTGIPTISIRRYRRGEGKPSLERAISILAVAYQARPHKQELPESAKYLSIGDVLHRED